jgi:hypothetical protein
MSEAGETAEKVIRIAVEGAEVALKFTGKAAERIIVLIYSILKDQQKTAGKVRLEAMLKSGKEMSVFTIPVGDLSAFSGEAKKYGVLYCALRDKKMGAGGTLDVMVYKEDASKINRIVEKLSLVTVAGLKDADEKGVRGNRKDQDMENQEGAKQKNRKEAESENPTIPGRENPTAREQSRPLAAEMENGNRSGHTSGSSGISERGYYDDPLGYRRSVRDEMEEIRKRRRDAYGRDEEKKRKPRSTKAAEPEKDNRAKLEKSRGPYYESSGRLSGRNKDGRVRK